MITGVVGLGLIGGSVARAYKEAGNKVYGLDIDTKIQSYAKLAGVIDEPLTDENLGECDLVFLALYPAATIDFVEKNRSRFKKGSMVMDCCGIKQAICEACFPIAEEESFTFVGGHPMAGNEKSGFKVSKADLFKGASMVVVPPVFDDIRLLAKIKEMIKPLGCKRFKVARAEEHDRMIAYTSQLTHIASNAFVKSPSAVEEEGYSGGSFRDLTRIAYLNENMWSELFLFNKGALLDELNILIDSLTEYRDAIVDDDRERLKQLLKDGRERKELLEEKKNGNNSR